MAIHPTVAGKIQRNKVYILRVREIAFAPETPLAGSSSRVLTRRSVSTVNSASAGKTKATPIIRNQINRCATGAKKSRRNTRAATPSQSSEDSDIEIEFQDHSPESQIKVDAEETGDSSDYGEYNLLF